MAQPDVRANPWTSTTLRAARAKALADIKSESQPAKERLKDLQPDNSRVVHCCQAYARAGRSSKPDRSHLSAISQVCTSEK